MRYSISELLDTYYAPEEYELEDPEITTAARIEVMTVAAIRPKTSSHPRRVGRTLLIAAVIALLLAVGAVAVYHYGLKDAVIEDVGLLPAQTDESETHLSLNGFSDSPEYKAYTEWNEWNNAWKSEHENRYEELGVDDTWYETPDNYAHLYDAVFAEQADKLEELTKKYGLTLHTQRQFFTTGSELYDALQTAPFLAKGYSLYGEYYYDDGSFKACGYPDESGWDNSFELITTVKGSFTQISSGLHEDAAEQEYTTADGTTLIMFTEKSTNRAGFIFSSEGCYVTAVIHTSDEQRAKALADAIDFGAIAALFETPQARAATAASVAAYRADYVSEPMYKGNWGRCYYSLGSYTLTLPAGYTHTGDTSYIRHEYYDQYTGQVISRYFRTDGDEYIRLSYKRFEGDEIASLEATRAEFEAEQEYRSQFASVQSCTVNGFEGYFSDVPDWNYAGEYQRRCLNWLDTDPGLWFILTSSEDIGDEALLSMAESVAEAEMPERYVCDMGASEGPPLGDTLSEGLTYDAAIDELGDLLIPSLHDRILAGTQRGRYEQNMFYWYLEADPCAYDGLTTLYRDGIALAYTRYWTDDSYTVSRGARSYADMKRFYGAAYEQDGFCYDLAVNGHDAFALLHEGWTELIWYDSGRDLVFTLSDTPDAPRSVYELIKLAEEIQ